VVVAVGSRAAAAAAEEEAAAALLRGGKKNIHLGPYTKQLRFWQFPVLTF
jgi:hypothetical protein